MHDVVLVGFGDHVDPASCFFSFFLDCFTNLREDMARAAIEDHLHRIEPEPVAMKIAYPHAGIVGDHSPDRVAIEIVEIHRRPPGGVITISQIRSELRQVISLGTEMVVDHVLDHGQSMPMRIVDELLIGGGSAIGILYRKRMDPVVPPISLAGELGDRHDLDPREAQRGDLGKSLPGGIERSFLGEGADVQFVEDQIGGIDPRPMVISPPLAVGKEDRRGLIDAVGLVSRDGIRTFTAVPQAVEISNRLPPRPIRLRRPPAGGGNLHFEVTVSRRRHGENLSFSVRKQHEGDGIGGWSPNAPAQRVFGDRDNALLKQGRIANVSSGGGKIHDYSCSQKEAPRFKMDATFHWEHFHASDG